MRCSIGCSPPPKFDVIFGSLLAISIATGMWHAAGIYTVRCSLMHATHNSCQTFVKRKPLIIEAAAKDYGTAAAVASGQWPCMSCAPAASSPCRSSGLPCLCPAAGTATRCGWHVRHVHRGSHCWANVDQTRTLGHTHNTTQSKQTAYTHTHSLWLLCVCVCA